MSHDEFVVLLHETHGGEMIDDLTEQTLIYRLRKRAEIRRQISTRKSVQEGQPDRISDLLEEAANEIEELIKALDDKRALYKSTT